MIEPLPKGTTFRHCAGANVHEVEVLTAPNHIGHQNYRHRVSGEWRKGMAHFATLRAWHDAREPDLPVLKVAVGEVGPEVSAAVGPLFEGARFWYRYVLSLKVIEVIAGRVSGDRQAYQFRQQGEPWTEATAPPSHLWAWYRSRLPEGLGVDPAEKPAMPPGPTIDLRKHSEAVLEEADRLRGYLQTGYPKTASGSLIIPGVSDEERRELLFGASGRLRELLDDLKARRSDRVTPAPRYDDVFAKGTAWLDDGGDS